MAGSAWGRLLETGVTSAVGRNAAVAGVTAAAAAAGAALGFLAERSAVRDWEGPDPYVDEVFGSLDGTAYHVVASDGVELAVQVDEWDPTRADPELLAHLRATGRDTAQAPLTIVMCHGYALNFDTWHFQRRALRAYGRVIVWDQRSHGRSGRSDREHVTLDQLGQDVDDIIAVLAGEGPLMLVGHSMGGMTLMSLARHNPALYRDRVVGVALVCTSPSRMDTALFGITGLPAKVGHRVAPAVVRTAATGERAVTAARYKANDFEYVVTRFLSFGAPVPPSLVQFCMAVVRGTPLQVVADFSPIFAELDMVDVLPVMDVGNVLVIGAETDRVTPVDHARTIRDTIPGARYVEYAPCGHMAMLERPDDVTAEICAVTRRGLGIA